MGAAADRRATLRVGIGGWSYAPWRQTFYPEGLPQARALEYASRQFTTLEINSTFYSPQKPATFAKWQAQTPADFVFTVKAPRMATHRGNLAEAGGSIDRFFVSGVDQLGDKLGPILWQFAPTKTFDAVEFGHFLGLLPTRLGDRPLRHALDVRHASFASAGFIDLAREHGAAVVHTDAAGVPHLADITGDFVYLRLREARAGLKTGYPQKQLRRFAADVKEWSEGRPPGGMTATGAPAPEGPRDVFVFFINGAKERAPAAALHMNDLLGIVREPG